MVEDLIKKMTWLGHDCFRIEAEKTIYFDPFEISSGPQADIILITHDHYDHCSPDDVAKIQGPDTVIVAEKDSAKKLSGDVRVMKPGDSVDINGLVVHAVPSYNIDKDFHPKKNGWLGYIIDIDGVKLYHAGDTDFIPEMSDIAVDIALLPVSGTYVMTADEAVRAALVIKPRVAIPMHYGSIVGDEHDAVRFKTALEGEVDVVILEKK
ncbi:MAG: MBL fold metallo-hydrolase [Deltaproteobacteria bacterium]|nr:MBL fold metallo-hydrolase [Deltaproteobacteria bacterium]